jgi:hypothetical protein
MPDKPFPIPDIAAPPIPFSFGKKAWGDVTSPQLLQGLSLIYYDSIKQRERNCFRQL